MFLKSIPAATAATYLLFLSCVIFFVNNLLISLSVNFRFVPSLEEHLLWLGSSIPASSQLLKPGRRSS